MDHAIPQLDGALLDEARLVLGDTTPREAIETALGELIRRRRRAAALAREVRRWAHGTYAGADLPARPGGGDAAALEEPLAPGALPSGAGVSPPEGSRGWLLHASALRHGDLPAVRRRLVGLVASGLLLTCGVTELELLATARSPVDHRELLADRRLLYRRVPVDEAVMAQALALQERVAEHARAEDTVGALLVVACARVHRLTVLHQDAGPALLGAASGVAEEAVLP